MALQMILGGAGSGKTHWLYDTVIHASMENTGQQYFVIVPEQFTMQAQKDIVALHPCHGTMNIDIVSFARLAYRIFEELAVENLQVLDDMGKTMVLRKVTAAKKRELTVFGGQLNKAGFIGQMKSMLSEFYQYGVTPDKLLEMAPQAGSLLFRKKLEELALVFQAFQDYISGHYIAAEEVLDVLCRVLPESKLIKNSVIALDGYTGFTPVQYRLTELFMVYAKNVVVTVTSDPAVNMYRNRGIQNLFYMSCQMVFRLTKLAEQNGITKLPDKWISADIPRRFAANKPLAFLEQHLFRFGSSVYGETLNSEIQLYRASNPSGEIVHVAHQIHQLVADCGMRYRDIAVITGDLPGYGREIAHQFEKSGIPHFMDDKKNVLDNPMVELIRAAIETVRTDFAYESVLRFLRTGLVTRDEERTDRLENYVIALGIRGGRRYREVWERIYPGAEKLNLSELNAFKDEVLAPLFDMQEAFRQEAFTVAGMVQAVRGLLVSCRVEEKLAAYQEYFAQWGEYRLAKEYGQVYHMVSNLLDRLEELLGEEKIGYKEFSEILDAGFGETFVGVIPATVDRVVVGDITRTRLAHIRVLFFVGVNDGIVPSHKDRGSLISDREREFFEKHGMEIAPTAREDSFQQRFYLYLMMTKPSDKLCVSFARSGGDGKSRRPSYLIGELKRMFPSLICREQTTEDETDIYSEEEARSRLIYGLRRFRDGAFETDGDSTEQRQFLELYRWFFQSTKGRHEAKLLTDAAFYIYERRGIGHAAARALYGNILSGSVTRLEQYAACAYAHFLKYGLELCERRRYELAAADIGNLFHDSIDLCFRKVKEEGKDWRSLSDKEREQLVHVCVEQITSEYGNTILNSSSRNEYLARRVEAITQRTVWALQQQLLRGDFTPAGFEVSFSAADHLKAMEIALSKDEALCLRGRIDRLDLCEDGDRVYVKVIDYKSGSTSFDLPALYYGLQMQLVVYMDAVLEMTKRAYPGREIAPAGIFYYNIANPFVDKEGQQDQERVDGEILRKLRMNGLINSELDAVRHLDHTIEKESDIIPVVLKDGQVQEGKSSVANRERFEALSVFVREKLKTAGQEILDGEVGVRPYKSGQRTACDYCPYHAVCGFDKKSSGYEFKRWKNRRAEEIWEELCREGQ